MSEPPRDAANATRSSRRLAVRGVWLAVTGVSLYLLFPSLAEVFSAGPRLRTVETLWIGLGVVAFSLSLACIWALQHIMLRSGGWFYIATSQLAGNALGRVVPGGGATAGALQFQMLAQARVDTTRIGSAVAATQVLGLATLSALPVVSLITLAGGAPAPADLLAAAWIGAAAFVGLFVLGVVLFLWESPLRGVGRAIQAGWNMVARHRPLARLPERLVEERDRLRAALVDRWVQALAAAIGRWAFDYLALLAALQAVNSSPDPGLVLLAFVLASLLALIPLTPGGLGFVEAGLTGTLVLAGVSAGDAVLATLVYRLISFWLPIPVGGLAYLAFRRRLRRAKA